MAIIWFVAFLLLLIIEIATINLVTIWFAFGAVAEKTAKIKAAEGEAEAIIKIQEATAQGLKLLKDASMNEAILKLKSYEAMVNVANGNATKIIVPSDLQGLVTAGTVLKETFKDNK